MTEALIPKCARVKAFIHYNSRNNWGYLEDFPQDLRNRIEVILADLRDYHAVEKATRQVDVVFHLGALIGIPYSLAYPNDVVETNIKGTLNILQACMGNHVSKIVHTSTSEVYGTAQYIPIDENHPLKPQSPYAASKVAADKLAESFFCTYGLPVSILRPFNTFGPRQSLRAIIPTIITQLLEGETLVVGSLAPTRDLTFVSDTVRGFFSLANKDGVDGETFNLGVGKEISVKDLIDLIAEIIKKKKKIQVDEARIRGNNSEVMRLLSNNSKASEILGWQPVISIEEGIHNTIEWIKDHKRLFKANLYNI